MANKIYVFSPKYYIKRLTKERLDKFAHDAFTNYSNYKDYVNEYEYDIIPKYSVNESELLTKLEADKAKGNKVVFIKVEIIHERVVHASFSYNKLDNKIAHLRAKLNKDTN